MEKKQLVVFELIRLQPFDTRLIWLFSLFHPLSIACVCYLLFGKIVALIFGLMFLFSFSQLKIKSDDIVKWSFRELFSVRNWLNVILYGGFSGLVFGSLGGIFFDFVFSITFGILCGIVIIFLVFMFGGVRRISFFTKITSEYQRLMTGIIFSIFSSLIFVISIYLIWYVLKVFLYPAEGAQFNIFPFAVAGLAWGIITINIVRHFELRLCLFFEGAMPLKYATFLDYAAEARILEKDGGQWRFRHQNLQEYFASLPD